jgi:hypothetical protein
MKRAMSKTPRTFSNGKWNYRNGPIENVRFDSRLRNIFVAQTVNVRRYNTIVNHRKLRLASYVSAPILRKKQPVFENNPTIS